VLVVLGFALPATAQEHTLPDTSAHSGAMTGAHVTTDDTAQAGAEEKGIGATLVHILSHHLMDAEEIEIFGFTVPLPTFHVGELRFITKHQVWWVIAGLLVFLMVGLAARQKSTVPTGMRNALEVLVTFIRDEVLHPNLHDKTDSFLPYFLTLFTSILFANLLGLLPWGSSATGNVNVTAGLAICTLLLMVGMGIKENGVGGFLHSFAPPGVPLWLMPLIIVIEIVSFMIRPFALTIRLFANMLAGHAVIAVLLGLIGLIVGIWVAPLPIAVSVGVMLLEIVVALIQAYIFTMLTAVFVGLTMNPAH
jgi:F-type H+-transporting ATPase subunit a